MTPYDSIPRGKFYLRMLIPGAFAFFCGLLLMGSIASGPMFQPKQPGDRSPTAELPAFQMAQAHFSSILGTLKHLPEICWEGNQVNDFQRRQCEDFWTRLYFGTGILAIPPLVFLVFLKIAGGALGRTYHRARGSVLQGNVLAKGTVTAPAQAPNDLFGWVYCLRPIAVQLTNRQQIKVYLSLDAPVPLPGQTLAVYDGDSSFGSRRYFGTLYAPHMAVVAGSR